MFDREIKTTSWLGTSTGLRILIGYELCAFVQILFGKMPGQNLRWVLNEPEKPLVFGFRRNNCNYLFQEELENAAAEASFVEELCEPGGSRTQLKTGSGENDDSSDEGLVFNVGGSAR